MKHSKKKKRSRASKEAAVGKAVECNHDKEEKSDSNSLTEAFASVSLEEAASAYREANGDLNKSALIPGDFTESSEDQITACSSSSGFSGSSSSDGFAEANCGQTWFRQKSKPKKLIATSGMVSTVMGKDYVSRDSCKKKGFCDKTLSKEDAEQFLCSMLGDECQLSMAVIRDVLCQFGYDIEKALNVLLELSSSSELSKIGQHCVYGPIIKEDTRFIPDSSDNYQFADRASDSTSHSSESELRMDNVWSMAKHCRNHSRIPDECETYSSANTRSLDSILPQMVLESLFKTPKSSVHEPDAMNWRNVVKKMESLGQRFEFGPSDDAECQQPNHAKGGEYQVHRKDAKQHWDSMKSYYLKAATAYTSGERGYAAYLSEQGQRQNKLAREADERASQNIFKARNKSIENVITIDLHGQHVKQAMRLLKLHLLFGAFVRSVRLFRVITGCGTHGVGKSNLKQSVISLVEKEGIEWREENRGTVLIKLNGQTEFSFLDSESDTD